MALTSVNFIEMSEKEQELKDNQEELDNTEESAEEISSREFGEDEGIDPIQKLENEVLEEKNKYLRLYAEFENFRRRTAKERIDLIGTANANLMKEMLTILDDFERAIQSNETAEDIIAVKEGFTLLQNKLSKILESKGLKSFDSMGQIFDADIHEAIAQVPVEDKAKKGIVIDVAEKGYELNDKIIRHPKVVVGN
jgi:molecular chaperone GrpE